MPVVPQTEVVRRQSFLEVTPEDITTRYVRLLGIDLDNVLTDYHSPELLPGTAEHAECLSATGSQLVVITNSGRPDIVKAAVSQLPGRTPYVNPSKENQLFRKPSVTMFNYVLATLFAGIRPENAAYIDDRYIGKYGAQKAGYRTFFWTQPAGENQHLGVRVIRPFEPLLARYT